MATFLSVLFGCKERNDKSNQEENIFPAERFSVIEATMTDGKPAIGSMNLAYKNYEMKSSYPWCLKLGIALNTDSCYENGLPKDNESKIAIKSEDELNAEIKRLTTAHYIGHLFNDTFLDIYIYLESPEKVHEYLQTQINKGDLARGFGYEINKDPTWKTVKEYLR
jgi:hypothetical protein